jgi:fibronectin-binding autotransporter adhesin
MNRWGKEGEVPVFSAYGMLVSSILGGGPQVGNNAQTASGMANLTFTGGGSYTRNSAGMLDITINANSTFSFTGAPSSGTAQGGAGDPILIGVTLNGADFVKAAAGAVVAPAYSVNNTPSSWTDNNIQVNGAINATAINNTTINSLRIATGGSATVNITGGQTLTIGSGMISSHVAWTMTGGSLTTSSSRDLILHNSANITATINSTITGNNPLLKSGIGTVTLGTSSGSNAIGDIYLYGGTLLSNLQGSLGQSGTPRTIYFQGGSLSFANSVTQSYTDKSLNVGPSGGTWTDGGTGASSSFGGSVTMNGKLAITGTGVKTLTGSISGAGMIDLAPTGSGRLTLSGDNSGWTGGMNIHEGAQLRLDNANAAGTGPIVNGNETVWGAALIDFTSTFGTTFPNSLIGQGRIGGGNPRPNGGFVISNAKTAAPVTLSGNLTTSGGLTFQGVDLGGVNVSETVLANSVAVSGSQPYNYNYAGPASGSATSCQVFVNGQGGINLGVTAYAGAAPTRLAYGTAGFLAYNAGTSPTTPVENGAEGYVRFAPDVNGYLNSFIPGAVGPGYVAALRKGGATALNFGYFLTGAKTSSGLTGTTTSGSILVTGLSSTAGYAVGQTITGTGIPGGTTIARIQSATSLALSANATATGSPTDIAISGSGTAYQLPEGKSFLIGTLGSGTGQTGTLGTTGTGSNTAILLGNPKAAPGKLLADIGGGDINIHANAAADTAALNLSARNATDTFVLGDGVTAANNVVITPTWGDSGAQTCMTLLRKRTGATTLNMTGAGTVEIKGANFTHTDGTDARNDTSWSVAAGTLYYNQNDAAQAGFAGVSLASGTTLKFKVDGATCAKMNVKDGGTVTLGSAVATLAIEPGAAASQSEYVLINVGTGGTVTGSFANSTVTVGSKSYRVVTNGGDGNDVALKQITPGTLIMFR